MAVLPRPSARDLWQTNRTIKLQAHAHQQSTPLPRRICPQLSGHPPPFETREAALVDANRCLYCYDAPCTKSCPTGIDIPKFIKQITTGNIKGSAHTIFQSNIMGGGCSRVCPVEKLCEGACVYNLMEEDPIPIARLQRYSTEPAIRQHWPLFQRKEPTGKKWRSSAQAPPASAAPTCWRGQAWT
ncbi:hypothetical protein ACQ86N_19535 [Puia sp. P3]|uniref:hypothetical protein n=1 Tax=Puia sp. P3 TaxID=3423952 RepID=UPI003D66D991